MACSFDAEMVANFLERREVERRAHEAALRMAKVNLTRPFEKSLLVVAVAATSSGDTTCTPIHYALPGKSPQALRAP